MNSKTTSSQVIYKSNSLIEARYRLNIWEQRLVLLLACSIAPNDEDFQDYELRVSDFAQMFGLDKCKAIYSEVESACTELVGKRLELSTPEKKRYASWLSYAEYISGSGVVKIRFDKSLKPYFLQLQGHFTKYNLNHVISFRNQYSIRLYELLKMHAFKAEQGKFSRHFTYQELRDFLSVEKSEYALFADFKKRIIEPSVKEISTHTDLLIQEIHYGKTGRRVTDIMFFITIRSTEAVKALQERLNTSIGDEQSDPIIEQLIGLGFAIETAKKYKTKYGVKRIERNIAYTLAKKQAGLVKDLPAYLNLAIKEDLGNVWEIEQTKQTAEQNQRRTEATEREAKQSAWEKRLLVEHDKKMAALLAERGLSVSSDRDELKALLAQLIGTPQETNPEGKQ